MSTKRTITTAPEDWSARLAAVNVSKDDLNALVANYLFTEGYHSAASHFAREAALDPTKAAADLESIRSRMEIRRAVQRGRVEEALDKVVELDPEILDHNPALHFHLLQQHLIELIRANRIPDALAFAQTELAPRGEEHPQFLKELERTMALLAFEMPTLGPAAPSPSGAVLSTPTTGKKSKKTSTTAVEALPPMPPSISSLLDPSQRLATALELNTAILSAQGHAELPKLPGLLGVLNWGEGLLSERGGDWPKWDLHEALATKHKPAAAEGNIVGNGAGDAMVL
ncbi:hypothetical protein JCM1841_006425 [Sporobolomyces salmonicolor]